MDKDQKILSRKLTHLQERLETRPPRRLVTLIFLRDLKACLESGIRLRKPEVENGRADKT